MFLCNIVCEDNFSGITYINICSNIADINVGIPTIIIGWDLTHKLYPNQSIIEKKITDDIFWTFSKTENSFIHTQDLEEFLKDIVNKIYKKITYKYFDIKTSSLISQKKMLSFVKSYDTKKYFLIDKDFIYVSYKQHVIGMSIADFEYLGITKDKIVKKIKSNNQNKIIYFNNIKNNLINFTNKEFKIILPYIYSIINE